MEQLGDYRLLGELARGTTGRVFVASRWPAIGGQHLAAVKLLNRDLARNERFVMLLREGVSRFAKFEHPGIVPVLEITSAAEQLLLVTELVDGQPLDRVLRHWTEQETEVDPLLSLWITQRLAAIMTAAHGFGLVHGHLAPDQVLITYEGEVRLLGLGMGDARGVLPLQERRRAFLAPEVLRTGVANASSDVHGLARVLHHALAGANSVLSTPGIDVPAWLPPLRSYGVTIHPALETMVEGMLAASPKGRPPLEDVESALGASVASRGPSLRSQLARLMQTAFTSEVAAATLRRKRAGRGSDEPITGGDFFAPHLSSRSVSLDEGDGFGRNEVRSESRPPFTSMTSYGSGAAAFHSASPSASPSASQYGWTETASLKDLSSDVFNGVNAAHHPAGGPTLPDFEDTAGYAQGPLAHDFGVAARAVEATLPNDAVSAADPRLRALESGDDEDVMALVDAIVSHATPPRGVQSGRPEVDDLLDGPLMLDDEEPHDQHLSVEVTDDHAPLMPPEPPPAMAFAVEPPSLFPDEEVTYPAERPAFIPVEPEVDDGTVYGIDENDDVAGLPLPEPLPPEAIFTDDVPRLPAGTVVGERYKIDEVIGEGGVSVVYRGSHSFLRKDVAIKVLRPELATMPPVVERFHREARSVAQLDHPNIVRVIDFGKSASGSLFLVMDLIEGISLADQIEREGWLAPTNAVRITISILTGLEHAHSRGVIHRDLKPDNIMIVGAETGPAEVKILDFGIAKLGDVEIGSRPITEAGMVFGTPRYMSPEQAAGEPVDHRSDLFTVGIILYQLLSGQLPFDGETTVQILRRVLTQPAPRLRLNGLPSATSEALADVVAQALAKNPEERFPSARTMREALQGCFPL